MKKQKSKLMIESIKYITGNKKSLKIQGPTTHIKAFQNVLIASKSLYEGLQLENSNLNQIEQLVAKKSEAAQKYFEITGIKWPL